MMCIKTRPSIWATGNNYECESNVSATVSK